MEHTQGEQMILIKEKDLCKFAHKMVKAKALGNLELYEWIHIPEVEEAKELGIVLTSTSGGYHPYSDIRGEEIHDAMAALLENAIKGAADKQVITQEKVFDTIKKIHTEASSSFYQTEEELMETVVIQTCLVMNVLRRL